MKFSLKDKNSNTPLLAHQTFVQFVNRGNDQEVVFVAEPDSSNVYRFDLVSFNVKFNYCLLLFNFYITSRDNCFPCLIWK